MDVSTTRCSADTSHLRSHDEPTIRVLARGATLIISRRGQAMDEIDIIKHAGTRIASQTEFSEAVPNSSFPQGQSTRCGKVLSITFAFGPPLLHLATHRLISPYPWQQRFDYQRILTTTTADVDSIIMPWHTEEQRHSPQATYSMAL